MAFFSLSGQFGHVLTRLLAICVVAPALVRVWCKNVTLPLDTSTEELTPFICLIAYLLLFELTAFPPVLYEALTAKGFDNKEPRLANANRLDQVGLPGRMVAVQRNMVEGMPIYLAGMFSAVHLQLAAPLAAKMCVLCVVCRVVYVPMYYLNIDMLRTLTWATGYFASLGLVVFSTFPELVSYVE